MSKQDRQGVRTPAALEQKYDFGQIVDTSKATAKHSAEIAQLGRDIARQGEITDRAIAELEQQLESQAEEANSKVTVAQSTADRALTTATSAASVASEARSGLASKVNTADIVDNLTTPASNKPLSAAQGVALQAALDALDARLKALEGTG